MQSCVNKRDYYYYYYSYGRSRLSPDKTQQITVLQFTHSQHTHTYNTDCQGSAVIVHVFKYLYMHSFTIWELFWPISFWGSIGTLWLPLYHFEAELLPAVVEEPHLDSDLILLFWRDLTLGNEVIALFNHIADTVLMFRQF